MIINSDWNLSRSKLYTGTKIPATYVYLTLVQRGRNATIVALALNQLLWQVFEWCQLLVTRCALRMPTAYMMMWQVGAGPSLRHVCSCITLYLYHPNARPHTLVAPGTTFHTWQQNTCDISDVVTITHPRIQVYMSNVTRHRRQTSGSFSQLYPVCLNTQTVMLSRFIWLSFIST